MRPAKKCLDEIKLIHSNMEPSHDSNFDDVGLGSASAMYWPGVICLSHFNDHKKKSLCSRLSNNAFDCGLKLMLTFSYKVLLGQCFFKSTKKIYDPHFHLGKQKILRNKTFNFSQ